MSESKSNKVLNAILESATPENIQKYVLGVKKSGHNRAIWDIVKDCSKMKKSKKKKKKKGKSEPNGYSFYLKAKKKKKKDKHWQF